MWGFLTLIQQPSWRIVLWLRVNLFSHFGLRAAVLGINQEFWKWQNLEKSSLQCPCMSSPFTPAAPYWILIIGYIISRVNVKLVSPNHNQSLFQVWTFVPSLSRKSKLSILVAVEVIPKIIRILCHIIEVYAVQRDSDQQVYVLLSVLGQSFYLSSKIFRFRTLF